MAGPIGYLINSDPAPPTPTISQVQQVPSVPSSASVAQPAAPSAPLPGHPGLPSVAPLSSLPSFTSAPVANTNAALTTPIVNHSPFRTSEASDTSGLPLVLTLPSPSVPPVSSVPSVSPASSVPSLPPVPSNDPASSPPTRLGSNGHNASTSAGSHAKGKPLYQCADCLRRYSRPEHLQRHIAAHTLGKRFTCDVCSKGFARIDLLKRHRANHDDTSGKKRRTNLMPTASRVGKACQPCAKARVKCEETKPCTRCKTRGLRCEVSLSEDALHLHHMPVNRSHVHPEDSVPSSSNASSAYQVTLELKTEESPGSSSSQELAGTVPSLYKEESQIPTPAASLDQTSSDFGPYTAAYLGPAHDEHTKPGFPDFIRDILYRSSYGDASTKLVDVQASAVLDFYDDTNFADFNDFNFDPLSHWNIDASRTAADQADGADNPPSITAMRAALCKLWTESPWRWIPEKTDSRYTEQSNLPLSSHDAQGVQLEANPMPVDRVTKDVLQGSSRDKILAIVLGTLRDNATINRVASSFPSTDAMDSWINVFLAAHLCQTSSWIHYASLYLNSQYPEWLAIAAAAGALLTPVLPLRRFGLALQEAVRVAIPERFEENNRSIADLGKVQALVMIWDVGLYSGNRRKMEIAECHFPIAITMMRYRGKFARSAYQQITIYPTDEGKILEDKWKAWCQYESWKRLSFHTYLRDAQISMTQFNNMNMSYAELTLPLPCSTQLWFARSAEEFKACYLQAGFSDNSKRLPSLGDLFRDISLLSANRRLLDVQFSLSIYLHGFWTLIWEYRQMYSIQRPSCSANPPPPNPLLEARREDLQKALSNFHDLIRGWQEATQEIMLLFHLILMNLYVSILDLQLFTGKEGEEQARIVYPSLQRWAVSPDARRALWHAGQILRHARSFPKGHLKEFSVIAVHHAALCAWTWGVIMRASGVMNPNFSGAGDAMEGVSQEQEPQTDRRQEHQQNRGGVFQLGSVTASKNTDLPVVLVDGEDETSRIQTWMEHGQGRPAIRGISHLNSQANSSQSHHHTVNGVSNTDHNPSLAASNGMDTAQASGCQCSGGNCQQCSCYGTSNTMEIVCCPLDDPRSCMAVVQEIIKANFIGVWESLPPLSENIVVVLKQLEEAARVVAMAASASRNVPGSTTPTLAVTLPPAAMMSVIVGPTGTCMSSEPLTDMTGAGQMEAGR